MRDIDLLYLEFEFIIPSIILCGEDDALFNAVKAMEFAIEIGDHEELVERHRAYFLLF